jgi:hypothetical protein
MTKKIAVSFLILIQFSLVLFAQDIDISMGEFIEETSESIQMIETDYDQEVVRTEFDIIRTSKETFRYLTDSYEYGIYVMGDDRIQDIDVEVFKMVDGDWTSIEKDEDEDAQALVMITPSTTAQYKIKISAYSFVEGYEVGFYCLAVFHE